MSNKVSLYFHTLKHLRLIQIRYRLWYTLRNKFGMGSPVAPTNIRNSVASAGKTIKLLASITHPISFERSTEDRFIFRFLNIDHTFKEKIDWNFNENGKLWTYNLNYFEFLDQINSSKEEGLFLINDFINAFDSLKDAKEPFPTSLRVMNWIKFLNKNQIIDPKISQSLYAQLEWLKNNLEFHLLGNHLLENAFALLFGAYYFDDRKMYGQAKRLLHKELKEQILSDGGHFELSPMYHQLMLFRVLDCINLVSNNTLLDDDFLVFLKEKAAVMLGWLKQMTFRNGDIPLLNDCSNNIAPSSRVLFAYAKQLKVSTTTTSLKESGYRAFRQQKYEAIVDVGEIGPDYQPGHAHSDTFNFVLYVDGTPFIVDTGTSTYEKNERRQLERSTCSHNTMQFGDFEQSSVWGGFRVGKRAKVNILLDENNKLAAEHDGYRSQKIFPKRTFHFEENEIKIIDSSQQSNGLPLKAFFHFDPKIDTTIIGNMVDTAEAKITFKGATEITLSEFDCAMGFNLVQKAKKLIIYFDKELETTIALK